MQENAQTSKTKRLFKLVVPPALTIVASGLILTTSLAIHEHQQQAAGSAPGALQPENDTLQIQPHPVDTTSPSNKGSNGASNGSHKTNPSSKHTTQPASSHKPSANQSDSDSQQTPTGDIGFGPVKGGTIQSVKVDDPELLLTGQSCVVTQYGTYPKTTWIGDSGVVTPSGQTIPFPKGVTANQFLGLSLNKGILWTVIAPSRSDGNSTPTSIYYTPYPSKTDVPASIASGATLLGTLPATVNSGSKAPWTGWYHPVASTANDASQNTTNANALLTTPGTAKNDDAAVPPAEETSDPTTAAAAQEPTADSTPAPATAAAPKQAVSAGSALSLYVRGFYQTSTGAVIVVTARDDAAGTTRTWLYLWNDASMKLMPIAELTNGDGHYGWFSVGDHLVYWENRNLQADDRTYQGAQYVMNVSTLKTTQIALGTWTPETIIHGDSLAFRVKQSVTWQMFVPDPALISGNP